MPFFTITIDNGSAQIIAFIPLLGTKRTFNDTKIDDLFEK
jgi:hypothetical protein